MNCLNLSLALLVLPSIGQAQVLISNLGDTETSATVFGAGASTQYKAYGFTMGATAFSLDEVILRIDPTGANPVPMVEIWDDAGGSPGVPLITLDNPAAFTVVDDYSFDASTPFTLSANTSYWVYVRSIPMGGDAFRWVSAGVTPSGPHATHLGYEFNGGISTTFNKVEIVGGTSSIGTNYCMANPNSTGMTGSISASGSVIASANNFTVMATNLPPNQFGIFVTSRDQGFIPNAGGSSNGNICLGGSIGRFFMASQIVSSGAMGEYSLQLPLQVFPQGNGSVAVLSGDTWNFQSWHRDGVGQGSNFTNGLEVMFQ